MADPETFSGGGFFVEELPDLRVVRVETRRFTAWRWLLFSTSLVIANFGVLIGLNLITSKGSSHHPFMGMLVIAGGVGLAILVWAGGQVYLQHKTKALSGDERTGGRPTDSEGERIQKSLDEYQQLTQRQARSSYHIAQVAIVVGFGVLAAGAVLTLHTYDSVAQLIVGGLAATGSAMSAYIASTAIRMYHTAQTQMNLYYAQPLVQGYILKAEKLAGKLSDDGKDAALARIIDQTLEGASVAGYLITSDDQFFSRRGLKARFSRESGATPGDTAKHDTG